MVFARCVSWLISFVWACSSCKEHKASEKNKMKEFSQQLDSNPVPSGYEPDALTIASRLDKGSTEKIWWQFPVVYNFSC